MSYRIELVASPYGDYATGDNPSGLPYYGVGVYDVPVGTTVAFRIIPLDPDYAFEKWIQDTDYGNDGTWDATRDYNTLLDNLFLSNTGGIGFRLTPVFTYVGTYTLTVLASTGGTTSPVPGTYPYNENDVVSLTALPDTGYAFSHWLLDGIDAGSENPTTLTMDASYSVQAVFVSLATYTLILAPSPNGVYDAAYGLTEGTHSIPVGEYARFQFIPSAGYIFSKWVLESDYDEDGVYDDIRDFSTDNPESFFSGSANITFRLTPIVTVIPVHTLSVNSNPEGIGFDRRP